MPDDHPTAGHEPHFKHVQLGVDLAAGDGDDRTLLPPSERDAVWDDAITVDDYKTQLEALRDVDPAVVDELRRARHGG